MCSFVVYFFIVFFATKTNIKIIMCVPVCINIICNIYLPLFLYRYAKYNTLYLYNKIIVGMYVYKLAYFKHKAYILDIIYCFIRRYTSIMFFVKYGYRTSSLPRTYPTFSTSNFSPAGFLRNTKNVRVFTFRTFNRIIIIMLIK